MKENSTSFWKAAKACLWMAALCLICMLGIRTQAAESKAAVSLKEPKIVSVNAPDDVTTALRVTWQPVERADGYIIYRRDGNSSAWVRIKKVAGQSKSYYSNIQLKPGSKYTYTVQSFCKVDGKVYYSSKGTNPVSAVTHLKTPVLKSAKSAAYNQIRIDWTSVPNAQGYRIYRREAGTSWKLVRRIPGQNKYFCIDSTVETGKQYYYTVRATCSYDGKLYLSGFDTKGIAGKATLGTSAITSLNASGGQVSISWKQIPGAQGYVVMRSNTLNGTYKKVRTAQGVSDTSFVDKNVAKGSTYYYKVRAFKQVDGKYVYGGYSAVKSVSVKLVEIMDYISIKYNSQTIVSDLKKMADAIGNMESGYYENIFQISGDEILIHQQNNPPSNDVNLIIQNTGNDGVTLFGIRIGDTYSDVKAKLTAAGFQAQGAVEGFFNYIFLYRDGTAAVGVKIEGGRMQGYKMSQLDPSLYYSSLSSANSYTDFWENIMRDKL